MRDLFGELWDVFPQNPSSSETKARKAFDRIKAADHPAVVEAAIRYAKWFAQDCEARERTTEAALPFVPHLSTWLDSGQWREAKDLVIRGELDPDLAIVEAGSDDFKAIERLRGKAPMVGQSGRLTVRKAELEQARAQAVH